jgi:hypothetical protein
MISQGPIVIFDILAGKRISDRRRESAAAFDSIEPTRLQTI